MELRYVDPRTLLDNPTNPRGKLPPDQADAQLEASIREHGIVQPPAAREMAEGLTVRWGSRRLRAALALGLPSVPVLVLGSEDHESEDEIRALLENVARKNMTPVDQWRAIERLASGYWSEEAIACALALDARTVRKLRLLGRLHPPMLERMHLGDMPGERDLRAIASAEPDRQAAAWKKHRPKKGERVAWWQLAQALAVRRMYATDALFDAEFAAAYGVAYTEDLFARADEDSRATANVDGFLAAQHAWLEAHLPENGVVLKAGQHGGAELPAKAQRYYGKPGRGGERERLGHFLDERTGKVEAIPFVLPEPAGEGASGRGSKGSKGEAGGLAAPAKARPDLTRKGEAMVGDMRTDALHAALRTEPIDDLRLVALLVLALGGQNVAVKTGEAGMEARYGRLAAIAGTVAEGGAVTSDPDVVRLAAREALVHVLSCRVNWSRSGTVARVAGDAVGADAHLPGMATAEFLACLSKPAVEGVAVSLGVPVQPTGKATRAAVVARVGEGRWVYPKASFSAGSDAATTTTTATAATAATAAVAAASRSGRRQADEDLSPDEPNDAPADSEGEGEREGGIGAEGIGAEDGWLEQAYDESVAEAA